jgi:hypothetical protein
MNDVLTDLRDTGLISASGFHDREEVRAHGNWNISDVDTELLCEYFHENPYPLSNPLGPPTALITDS